MVVNQYKIKLVEFCNLVSDELQNFKEKEYKCNWISIFNKKKNSTLCHG